MELLKLISNRISTEWKEKFNKNIDYLNDLEKKLSDQDNTTNSRIDNLVLHSGGDSPNEIVDARVNAEGTIYPTLYSRLLASDNLFNLNYTELKTRQDNQQGQLNQLNDSVGTLMGAYGETLDLYVAKDGNNQTGDGTEAKPFLTIQAAVNQIPLLTSSRVTIWISDGSYLEDVVVRNLKAVSITIRNRQNVSDTSSELGVKVRSIAFISSLGYQQINGLQFVDQANISGVAYIGGDIKCAIYSEQSSYLAVWNCRFAENTFGKGNRCLFAIGASKIGTSNNFYQNQNCIAEARNLADINIDSNDRGSGNDYGVIADNGTARVKVAGSKVKANRIAEARNQGNIVTGKIIRQITNDDISDRDNITNVNGTIKREGDTVTIAIKYECNNYPSDASNTRNVILVPAGFQRDQSYPAYHPLALYRNETQPAGARAGLTQASRVVAYSGNGSSYISGTWVTNDPIPII
ncbi:hypothetical protein EWU52_07665 [Enterococcus faecium]|uniref:hypothetical protein n=1 Tax=Enterococcus faecium TaxID=1352 RepID=UPI00102EF9F1|nr:hypothetical protein [Enterococcus faecium]TAQ17010.1 hypothetical protein EWU52_07665 [Enterococcus faecium]